jgi:serine-type D-Ala-D-Ala carboxypeptidase (penicillin-binding protein 5/6)
VQWVGVVALVGALVVPAAPPSAGCAGQDAPPPPPAPTEQSAQPPAPLPWPAEPVGGARMGECGDIGPPGVPSVGAASYVVADLDTGAIIAARAPHARHRPASTLKILTALVAIRRLNPDTVVDGAASDLRIDGSKAGIGPGGHYTVRELLGGLLLNSGNDTAEALARALGGDAATTSAMASTAAELGALDTRPASVSGLDAPGISMSAYDLAAVFRVAMREPLFASTIGLASIPFPGYPDHPGFQLTNNDRLLLNYKGTLGAKAGFTDAARHTQVGVAERNGRRLIVTLMRGEQHPVPMWKQAAALLDFGFAQPKDAPSVGTLVDAAPSAPQAPGPDARAAAADVPAAERISSMTYGIAAVVGAVAATMFTFMRRRARR